MHHQHFKRFQLTTFTSYGLDFLFAQLKKSLAGMCNMNEKNSKVKVTGRTFPENLNGKLLAVL